MITRSTAMSIVERFLDDFTTRGSAVLRFVVTRLDERRDSWVAYYDSEKHQKSGNVVDAIAGNGPLVVSKRAGAIVSVPPTGFSEALIAEAEAKLLREGG